MRLRILIWLIVILTIGAQALFYLHILPLSLGPRVVLQPWLMQRGYLLYKNIADEHPPLLSFLLLAMQPIASDSLQVAKFTLILLISVTTLLTFWAGKQDDSWLSGILSLFFFTMWSPIFGYGKLWHETLLSPIYLLILMLWQSPTYLKINCRLFFIGVLLGIALLVKQHATAVIFGILLWFFFKNRRDHYPVWRSLMRIIPISLGVLLPIGAFTVYYWLKARALRELLFWLVTFNFINHYTQLASLQPSFEQIRLLAPAYIMVLPAVASMWDQRTPQNIPSIKREMGLVLLITSSLTVYPRFGFFHLQASLPILAWLSGTTMVRFVRSSGKSHTYFLKGVFWSVLLLWMLYTGPIFYKALRSSPPQKIYEYSDLVPLANEIRQHVGPTECIYVLPDDEATANLYYLTQCLPPSLWVPTSYPWFMIEKVKPQVVSTLEDASPDWIVYFPGRWGIEQHGQELLNYVRNHYQLKAKLNWAEGEVWLLKKEVSK